MHQPVHLIEGDSLFSHERIATRILQKTMVESGVFDPHEQIIILWIYRPGFSLEWYNAVGTRDFGIKADDRRCQISTQGTQELPRMGFCDWHAQTFKHFEQTPHAI